MCGQLAEYHTLCRAVRRKAVGEEHGWHSTALNVPITDCLVRVIVKRCVSCRCTCFQCQLWVCCFGERRAGRREWCFCCACWCCCMLSHQLSSGAGAIFTMAVCSSTECHCTELTGSNYLDLSTARAVVAMITCYGCMHTIIQFA
jgi:hypothetical protein